tara:strand:+ start:149 stop:460 length:312 start_codon:yes stop_codon:yes gene_type:complete
MGEIRFSTSFRSKHTMALQCYRDTVETKFNVRVVVEVGEFNSGSVDVYGRDEDRVVKAMIDIINAFPEVFKGINMGEFSTDISTFNKFLDHPRSYGMGFSWSQ